MEIKKIKNSKKGASLLELDEIQFWVKPQAAKIFEEENRLTPAALKSFNLAKAFKDAGVDISKKNRKLYYKFKPKFVKAETEKAVLIVDWQMTDGWIPKKCILDNEFETWIVEAWILEEKGFQHQEEKIWI